MKRFLLVILVLAIAAGIYYGYRLLPLMTTDNTGSEKVVLLHGLGRSETSMLLMESALTEAGFDVHSIGYPSTEESPDVLLAKVTEEINACCKDVDETVHFVGHSLGGLLIRAYLAKHEPRKLGSAVFLGTPNKGSELADPENHESIPASVLDSAGPTAMALNTGPDGFPASLPPPHYPVGIIAGTRDNPASNTWLPVPNDGMVSVESAKLDGMTDFVTVGVSHFELRSDKDVLAQLVAFLKNGEFDPESR